MSDFTFSYDYTVEGMIKSDRVPKELWMEICNTVQEVVIKLSPRKRNVKKKKKRLFEEDLHISEERREVKKERYTHLSAVPKNSKER